MSGLFTHLISILTKAANVEFIGLGSTTYKLEEALKGAEPDDCFYIQNVAKAIGKDEVDLETAPPPDLVIEIDVSHPSLKLSIYAAMGVKEIWRQDSSRIVFLRLVSGEYEEIAHSDIFALLPSCELARFLDIGKREGINAMRRVFRPFVDQLYQSRKG